MYTLYYHYCYVFNLNTFIWAHKNFCLHLGLHLVSYHLSEEHKTVQEERLPAYTTQSSDCSFQLSEGKIEGKHGLLHPAQRSGFWVILITEFQMRFLSWKGLPLMSICLSLHYLCSADVLIVTEGEWKKHRSQTSKVLIMCN